MSDDTLTVEHLPQGIVRVTLDRRAKRNAIDAALRRRLREAFEALAGDDTVRAVVVTGAGGHFCAGGDVASMRGMSADEGAARMAEVRDTVLAIAGCPAPTIACVEGDAAGAGVGLALLCDEVIAAPGARFSLAFGRVGLAVDWGLSVTLPDRIGRAAARRLAWDATRIDAAQAQRLGLVDRIAPASGAMSAALERARAIAALAPGAVRGVKAQMRIPADALCAALEREAEVQARCFASGEFAEGVAAFLEKREPRFGPG